MVAPGKVADQLYHDQIAVAFDASYDTPAGQAYTEAFSQRIIAASPVPLGPQSSILDLGCGSGRFAVELAKRTGASVVAVDHSKEMARLARTRAAIHGASRLTVLHVPDGKLPLQPHSFDLVLCFGVLHHVVGEGDPDLQGFLGQMRQASRGGVMCVEPNVWNPYFFGTTYVWHDLQRRVAGFPRVEHERPFGAGFLRRQMMAAGLRRVAVRHESPVAAYFAGRRAARAAEWLLRGPMRPFSTHLVGTAVADAWREP